MAKMDIGAALGPAFQHTGCVLFKPFVFRKWLALGFVSILAAGGGGFHLNLPSNTDSAPCRGPAGDEVERWLASHLVFVAAAVVAILALALVLGWVACVLRLVFVEQIARSSGAIRDPFHRLRKRGTSYFLWTLAFSLVCMVLAAAVAIPIVVTFVALPNATFVAKFGVVALAILIGTPLFILVGCVMTIADDFVIPTMYVRFCGVVGAWRVVLPLLKANAGQTLLYLLMLIVIAIGSAIVAIPVGIVAALAAVIPIGLLFLICYVVWTAAALTWNAVTISVAVALGTVSLCAIIYAVHCVLLPIAVFRRSFSLVVLGQADPTLMTVPIATATPIPPPSEGMAPSAPESVE